MRELMATARDFIKPNALQLALAYTLLFPMFCLVALSVSWIAEWSRNPIFYNPDIFILFILACIISYIFGNLLDHFIKNRALKGYIVFFAAIVSIVIVLLLLKPREIYL